MKDFKIFDNIKKLKEYKIQLPFDRKTINNESYDFNFFQPYIGVSKKKRFKYLYITTIASTITFVFAASFIWNYINIDNTEHDIAKLKKTIDSPQTKLALDEANNLKKKYGVLNKYYAQANSITNAIRNKDIIGSELMGDLCSAVPNKVSFKAFNVTSGEKGSGGSIDIQGTAEDRVNIGEFEHNLKALKEIKDVQVSNITDLNGDKKSDTNNNNNLSSVYSFSIKCTLKDVDEYEDK